LGDCKGGLFQEKPDGEFSGRIDLTVGQLEGQLNEFLKNDYEEVYAYVVKSVEFKKGEFVQCGCAPNFQGGVITLCTCRHGMRATSRKRDSQWKDTWIAGFTGGRLFDSRRSYLFYLMRVKTAFPSHKKLWNNLDKRTQAAKDACHNPLGDLYEPKNTETRNNTDDFDHLSYNAPCIGHRHREDEKDTEWHKDIDYMPYDRYRRHAWLLLGDEKRSYLWFSPIIPYKNGENPFHPRTRIYKTVDEFMSMLR
jgi:hypothetical protein